MKKTQTPPLCEQFADAPGAQAAWRLFEACRQVDDCTTLVAEFLVSLCDRESARPAPDGYMLCRRIDDVLITDIIAVMMWFCEGLPRRFNLQDIFGPVGDESFWT